MKILVVSDLYPPYHVGGYEINCRDSVTALTDRGHDVTVLTSVWGADRKLTQEKVRRLLDYDPSFLDNDSSRSVYFLERLIQLRNVFISRRNYAVTHDVISALQPDIVYLWHLGHLTVSPALAAQDAGVPVCFRIEDYSLARIKKLVDERVSFFKRLYRYLVFNGSDIKRLCLNNLLFISQHVMNYYLQAGFPSSGMDVIPSGVPLQSLSDPASRLNAPFVPGDGIIRLVFSGRLEPEKGPDVAIKAVAILKSENPNQLVCLDIIGDGNPDFLNYLKRLTVDLSVSDRISFLGKFSQSEVVKRFQSADALLFTSRWQEPFGRVVIEAMSQGLPVIAVRSGGVPEIINDSQNGFLVKPDDPQEMANAVKALINDPILAAAISHNAFAAICSRFTLEMVVERMENYMFDVVKSHDNV